MARFAGGFPARSALHMCVATSVKHQMGVMEDVFRPTKWSQSLSLDAWFMLVLLVATHGFQWFTSFHHPNLYATNVGTFEKENPKREQPGMASHH